MKKFLRWLPVIIVGIILGCIIFFTQYRVNMMLLIYTVLITIIAICASIIANKPKGKFHIKPMIIGAIIIWIIAVLMSCTIH